MCTTEETERNLDSGKLDTKKGDVFVETRKGMGGDHENKESDVYGILLHPRRFCQ